MTKARFKRLFIVLLGPLLVLGAAVAYFYVYHIDKYATYIYCDPIAGVEDCITLREPDYEATLEPRGTDFDVVERYDDEHTIIQAFRRSVQAAEIIDIGSAYRSSRGGWYKPKNELDPIVSMNLTPDPQDRSSDRIECMQLDITKISKGVFIANRCTSPMGMLSGVEFRVKDQDKQVLNNLVNAVRQETSAEDARKVGRFVLITPIFVFLFLVLSGLIWLFRRAKAYVLAA